MLENELWECNIKHVTCSYNFFNHPNDESNENKKECSFMGIKFDNFTLLPSKSQWKNITDQFHLEVYVPWLRNIQQWRLWPHFLPWLNMIHVLQFAIVLQFFMVNQIPLSSFHLTIFNVKKDSYSSMIYMTWPCATYMATYKVDCVTHNETQWREI